MMPQKLKKAKRKTEEEEDDENTPFPSHSKEKKKHKKNPIDNSTKKKMKKEKIAKDNEGEEKEENEAGYLPGQKHDRPHERDPLRIFFETLYQQLPGSELASTWMLEWGLLPRDEATEIYQNQLNGSKMRKVSENISEDNSSLSKKRRKTKQKVSSA